MGVKSAAPWSFSKFKAFNTCPRQFYNERVLKRYKQEETHAMRYGTLFHEAAEHYIATDTPLPEAFRFAQEMLDRINSIKGGKHCEQKMGLTVDLERCDFDASSVWWRGIADLNIINNTVAYSIDYKTGSKKSVPYADKGQLELIALAIFIYFPEVQTVKAGLLFVVANAFIKGTYHRSDVPKLWAKWLGRFQEMDSAYKNEVWNTKQSGLCHKHCPVLECHHNGRG